MYRDDFERPNYADRNSDDVWSKPVRAGKRTYFFDVKTTKGNNDYYLTITLCTRKRIPCRSRHSGHRCGGGRDSFRSHR